MHLLEHRLHTHQRENLSSDLAALQWLLRHVYYPCMRTGMAKHVAGVVVFLVSAVFHELLVGLPLHMLRAWSFIGIMSQVSHATAYLAALPCPVHDRRAASRKPTILLSGSYLPS